MSNRFAAALAIAASALFMLALILFAALRPDYSHFTKAISELGTWGAPNMWAFNILGYVLPGVLSAVFGWKLASVAAPRNWLLAILLPLGGAGLALAGAFPGDMNDLSSPTTIVHAVGAIGSGLAWLLALIVLALSTYKTWPMLAASSAIALGLSVGAFFLYGSDLPPGLVQRISFALFFGWHVAAALLLARRPG